MATGKYLSLEEARKAGKLKQFAKEHPSVGDWGEFDRMFDAMMEDGSPSPKTISKASRTSSQGDDDC